MISREQAVELFKSINWDKYVRAGGEGERAGEREAERVGQCVRSCVRAYVSECVN